MTLLKTRWRKIYMARHEGGTCLQSQYSRSGSRKITMNLGPDWATQETPGYPGLHSKTWSQKPNKNQTQIQKKTGTNKDKFICINTQFKNPPQTCLCIQCTAQEGCLLTLQTPVPGSAGHQAAFLCLLTYSKNCPESWQARLSVFVLLMQEKSRQV